MTETGLVVGAAVTLSDLEDACNGVIASHPTTKTRVLKQVVDMLK